MILLDGPMGTELAARGVPTPPPGWSAYALETRPEVVRAVHAEYVRAGAELHRANTFRTQPRVFPDRFVELARVAVSLAREAGAVRVAGSLSPVEDCYRPDLAPSAAEARRTHRAVAEALRDAGVDLIVCETFPHAGEALVAVEEAARTGLEAWVALTAGPDATLMTPEALEHAARDAARAGAVAVLVNCTAAARTLPYVERLSRVGVPFGAYANAGAEGEGLGWGADPASAADAYAELASRWIDAGASIVGGCCGTGPTHVAELARRFGGGALRP